MSSGEGSCDYIERDRHNIPLIILKAFRVILIVREHQYTISSEG